MNYQLKDKGRSCSRNDSISETKMNEKNKLSTICEKCDVVNKLKTDHTWSLS